MAKPTSKDAANKAAPKTPGADELSSDDLQDVTGGVLVNRPTGPVTAGPTTGPVEPTDPVCIGGRV